ncbi:DMT family transporter [Variovorax sp. J22G73]|uniref:DMT family transporter n=1 Tax=unclassified Variovorax TaxID=663243 RepID=UPI000D5DEF95|nr:MULTISPECIES: DMT family transporter [unclassified Variovorax]MDM0007505.1 DMT family transporter [Variovorax sp. J22R203]MDM0100135.1 DMT family transporter [Variovorax sp. J22G73]
MPALALVFNAFVWGLSWFPFRQLAGHGLHPLWTTCLIYLAIAAVMGLVRRHAWKSFAAFPMLVALGLAAGFTNVGFNWAATQGDVVRVVLLFYLMPLWNVLLAWLLLGERPTGGALARVALALAGVVVVLKAPGTDWPVPSSLPDWLGVAAGFSFALTNITLRHLRQAPGESRALAMFCGCAVVGGATALVGTGMGGIASPLLATPGWLGWAVLLGSGFIVANVCLQYGAARLTSGAASVIMLSEVLFAAVSSVALGAATMDARILVGGALIVAGAVWSACAGFARTPVQGDDRGSSGSNATAAH